MYPRRRYVRKPYVKKSTKLGKIVKGKVNRIQTLAKVVQSMQRKMKTESEYINMAQTANNQNITGSPFVLNLSQYNAMTAVFGTAADDLEANRIIHKSFGIDGYISLENTVNDEESTIGFTCFLVSLKDQATGIFNASTGGLTLSSGATHADNGKGMILLNKKYFNIHNIKRFFLSNHNTSLAQPSAQTQYGTDRRFYMKLSPNKAIQNPQGNWHSLNSALDPSKQYYFIIFSDNTTADLESPTFSYSVVHTFKTVA